MSSLAGSAVRAVERAEIRGTALSMGRSLLAIVTLGTILFTADSALFIHTSEHPLGMRCGGVRAVSLWCLAGDSDVGHLVSRVIAVIVLVVVLTGFRPAWTCIPHWYVTVGLASAMPIPNGGDNAAQFATLLLIPMCVGDPRRWQWEAVTAQLSPSWRGCALAGHIVLRAQLVIVYATAVWWKLSDPLWRQGSVMHVISGMPQFGFPSEVRELLAPVLGSYWLVALFGWAIIVGQIVIVLALPAPRRFRLIALAIGVALHVGIIVLMNLMGFGLIMIAVLVIACARTTWAPRPAAVPNERMSS